MDSLICYRAGYKYQLAREYSIDTNIRGYIFESDFLWLHSDGKLVIKKGYAWDGPSGGISTKSFMRGSLVHDALYQLMREKVLPLSVRTVADGLLKKICKEDGMFFVRAAWVHLAVRIAGAKFTQEPTPIICAP